MALNINIMIKTEISSAKAGLNLALLRQIPGIIVIELILRCQKFNLRFQIVQQVSVFSDGILMSINMILMKALTNLALFKLRIKQTSLLLYWVFLHLNYY